jgi:diguanylate cyclase (GGDEF)-like protein
MTMNRSMSRTEIRKRLLESLRDNRLGFDIINSIAGDVPWTDDRRTKYQELFEVRGDGLYSDILFAIAHKAYPPEQAKEIWGKILQHKWEISSKLNRNVGIVVAVLDYLSNIEQQFESPLLISEKDKLYVAEIALNDDLTDIYDHMTFMSIMEKELTRHQRYGEDVSFVLADLDNFKAINDTFGHPVGDTVLKRFVDVLKREIRQSDVLGRCGGEEFGILLIKTDATAAGEFAERVRKRTKELIVSPVHLMVSMGVASCPTHCKSASELVIKADEALIEAKNLGKDRVVMWNPEIHAKRATQQMSAKKLM